MLSEQNCVVTATTDNLFNFTPADEEDMEDQVANLAQMQQVQTEQLMQLAQTVQQNTSLLKNMNAHLQELDGWA